MEAGMLALELAEPRVKPEKRVNWEQLPPERNLRVSEDTASIVV
jgi:hypothetical protein